MMSFSRRVGAVVLSLLTLAVSLSFAQLDKEQLGVPTDLDKYKEKDYALNKFLSSGSKPGKDEKSWMDLAARYYIFRVTWLDHVNNRDIMSRSIKEFAAYYDRVIVKNKQLDRVTSDYYHKQFADCLAKVFARKFEANRVSSVNAAQMLPIVAKGRSEDVADLLVKLVEDPNVHDAVKLYAVRGLREYFSQRIYTKLDLIDPKLKAQRVQEVKRVAALDKYIGREWPAPANKFEVDAQRYLRKEAIESLAQAQVPAITGIKEEGKVEGPVAVTLLKVFAGDKLQPAPSLAERCEAAIGLCNLKYNDKYAELPEYQGAPAAYAVAKALTQFIDGYRADYSKFLPKKEVPVPPLLPWKVTSDRFKDGLQALVANSRNDPAANALAKELQEKSRLFLDDIKGYKQIDNELAQSFRTWVKNKAPAAKGPIFKNLKAPSVDLE